MQRADYRCCSALRFTWQGALLLTFLNYHESAEKAGSAPHGAPARVQRKLAGAPVYQGTAAHTRVESVQLQSQSTCYAAWGPADLAYLCYCMRCRLTELLAKYAGLMRTSGGYSRPGTSNPVMAAPAPPEDGAGAVGRPATSDTALQVGASVHQQAGTTIWLV